MHKERVVSLGNRHRAAPPAAERQELGGKVVETWLEMGIFWILQPLVESGAEVGHYGKFGAIYFVRARMTSMAIATNFKSFRSPLDMAMAANWVGSTG